MANIQLFCLVCLMVGSAASVVQVPDFMTTDQVRDLVAKVTAPLMDRIDTLERKMFSMEETNTWQRDWSRNQESKLRRMYGIIQQLQEKRTPFQFSRPNSAHSTLNESVSVKPIITSNVTTTPINSDNDAQGQGQGYTDDVELPKNGIRDQLLPKTFFNGVRHTVTKRAVETPIAFSVEMNRLDTPLNINQDIVFDTLVTNIGGAYNVNHGIFLAPISGLYVFSATIMTGPAQQVDCAITINGQVQTKLFAYSSAYYDQGSQTIVVQLNKGDDVSVRATYHAEHLYGQLYSSFTGFLYFET